MTGLPGTTNAPFSRSWLQTQLLMMPTPEPAQLVERETVIGIS